MYRMFILLAMVTALLSCGSQNNPQIVDDSQVIAVVGEQTVTTAAVDAYLAGMGLEQATEQQRAEVFEALIKQTALAQQARKDGLQVSLQQQLMLQQAQDKMLAQAAREQHVKAHPVTAEQLQEEYQRITAQLQGQEYRVRHMLFQDEAEAIEILDGIQTASDYLQAEAAYLQANPNVRNVGDIGWVNIMQVPEAMRQPIQNMAEQSTHPQTVVSQYGVHIIHLAGIRPLEAPAFEAVKEGIRKSLEQKKIDRYEQLAVVKAKVQKAAQ